jgi:predicted dehydrogenase
MKKIKVAFFGLAHPHCTALLKAIMNAHDDFEIIGFAEYPTPAPDPSTYEKRRLHFIEKAGAVEFENYTDLIAKNPDLAVLNTDNASRSKIACELLEKGINVIGEKPMAVNVREALKMYDAAKASGARILTNWPIAWFQSFRCAKKLLDEGRIGKLMRVTYRSPATWGPFSYSPDGELPPEDILSQSWWYKAECGGGSILDYACYGTVLSTWFFGKKAESVQGISKNFCTPFSDVEDYSAMILDFGDGVGLLEGSWSTYNPGEIPSGPVLYGTEGVIVCDRHSNYTKLYVGRSHKPSEPTEVYEHGKDAQAELMGPHIAKVLRGEEKAVEMLSEKLNLWVVAALDAGRQSADQKTGVSTENFEI